ncbi:MAG TPA: tetratricopeptide repeat protein [Usitatibacter sp.]|nr:tetratricopeptide repeat protein [Usitatibacter sp.]
MAEPLNETARVDEARQFHRRGDFARAIDLYDEVLAANPALADVWHLKGMAEHQAGLLDQALASAGRAREAGGEKATILLLEGGVLQDRGDAAGAHERFVRAVAASPNWAPAHMELGSSLLDLERVPEAVESFRTATSLDPKNVRAWNNLGVALQTLDRLDDALRTFNHALSINPGYAQSHFNVARIYNLRYETKRALEHAQAATRLDPKHVEAWLLVGDMQRRLRDANAALAAYTSAAQVAPDNLKAVNVVAEMLAEMGRFDEARRGYWRIWQQFPSSLRAGLGANLLLPQVYVSQDHLDIVRREYGEGLERLHAAADGFKFARAEAALTDARWTNFYLAYQGKNDRDLQRRYGEFHRRVLEAAAPQLFRPRPKRKGGDRLRVGFFSHFFFNCTAGRYFSSWITHLDPKRFEKFVYYTNEWVADDTRTIAAAAQAFRHLPGRSLHALARHVLADELDVLVFPELGMHAETFTLAGLRLAPVQVSGWGHPNTPGLPAIDWYFSCESMEPADARSHYSERLGLLPGLGTRYGIPKGDDKRTRSEFGLPEGRTLYLVPQSLFKIHPDNDDLIARVISGDPDATAVLFASNHDPVTQALGARLGAAFRRHGIDIHQRAIFLMPNVPHPSYLRLNELCDVMLDTLHWSGGNTSLDALSSGLPVVTLPGEYMRGRQSQAMLRALEVPQLIAPTPDEYVATALRLGQDKEERRAVSERLLANRPALFEREEPIRALEDLLERAWRDTPEG